MSALAQGTQCTLPSRVSRSSFPLFSPPDPSPLSAQQAPSLAGLCAPHPPLSSPPQIRARSVHNRHLAQRGAAVLIQRRFRRFLAEGGGRRRKDRAATRIQSCWRGHVMRARCALVWGGGVRERGARIGLPPASRAAGGGMYCGQGVCGGRGDSAGSRVKQRGGGGEGGAMVGLLLPPGCSNPSCFRAQRAPPSFPGSLSCAAWPSPSKPPSVACLPAGYYLLSRPPPQRCRRPGACAAPAALS